MEEWHSRIIGIIDGHVHMGGPEEEAGMLAIRQETGIEKMALVSIQNPAAGSGLPGSLYIKARHPRWFYVFAGLNHAAVLSAGDVETPTLVEQVDEFLAMGLDGIKMIEGKPTSRQRMDVPLTDPYYAAYWAHVEELGIPIVWHVNDPEEFWDPEQLPVWAKERGWGYGPEDVQKEQLYAEVEKVLARHPRLNVTFAHFFFLSADLERAGRFLDAHPSVRVDLAPGVEMLHNMSRDVDASREFFTRYADRIVFGTDLFSSLTVAEGRARAGIVYRWLESEDVYRVPEEADFLLGAPEDGLIRGMALPDGVLKAIYHGNFVRAVSEAPNQLDVGRAIEACGRIAATAEEMSGTPAAETQAAQVARLLAEG